MLKLFSKKNNHTAQTNGSLLRLMMPSLLGLVLCAVCLTGTTWAWFTLATSGDVESQNSAVFSSTVTVQQLDSDPVGDPISERAYSDNGGDVPARFTFDRNNTYRITIEPDSNSSASRGYCLISFLNEEGAPIIYRTAEIGKSDSVSFTYQNGITPDGLTLEEEAALLSEPDALTVVAYWGEFGSTSPGFKMARNIDIRTIEDGVVIGTPPKRISLTKNFSLGKYIEVEHEAVRAGVLTAVLKVAEGYELPELIEVNINKDTYSVPTDGDTKGDGPTFDAESNELTIPSNLLTADPTGSIEVTVLASAVKYTASDELPQSDPEVLPQLSADEETEITQGSE